MGKNIVFVASRPFWNPVEPSTQRGPKVKKKEGRGAKMTNHLHPLPKLRMHGTKAPLPTTSSWRGAQLSTGTTPLLPVMLRNWDGRLG